MGKKYIIELEDKNYHQYSDSEPSDYLWRVKGFNALVFDEVGISKLTPYTEPDLEQIKADWYKAGREAERVRQPDLEQVRKEAYDKCMSEAEDLAYKLYSPKIDVAYQRGLADGKNQDAKDFADMYDSEYDEGLKDAWEAARKICTNWVLSDSVLSEIFGMDKTIDDIMKETTASEAIEKIRAYEKEKEEFHVGDEFKNESGKRFVILKMDGEEIDRYIDEEGKTYCMSQKYKVMRKTSRHFPEIAEVLRKMREDTDG